MCRQGKKKTSNKKLIDNVSCRNCSLWAIKKILFSDCPLGMEKSMAQGMGCGIGIMTKTMAGAKLHQFWHLGRYAPNTKA